MVSRETPWHSLIPYQAGLDLQKLYEGQVHAGHPGYIMGCEHFPVVTLGKRGREHEDLTVGRDILEKYKVDYFVVDRGGQATLHAPGQLVIYPVLPLRKMGIRVRDYLSILEETSICTLRNYGVQVERGNLEPGLYSAHGKMVFFGIRLARGVSQHGLAINVNNNLDNFSFIRSCGVQTERFDKLDRHRPGIQPQAVFHSWSQELQRRLV